MNDAFDRLRDKTFTHAEMTALDWVVWNSRADLPRELLEQAAEEKERLDGIEKSAKEIVDNVAYKERLLDSVVVVIGENLFINLAGALEPKAKPKKE